MDLFNPTNNLLPFDGKAIYYGKIIRPDEANKYLNSLQEEIAWEHDEVNIFGKHIVTKRKVAWYGDNNFAYTYSNATKVALPWSKLLKHLKEKVEKVAGATFNSCLLNLYHNGDEGMGWHSDNEKELGNDPIIASVSFGAERKFALKHKETNQTCTIILEHGSLLVMKEGSQKNWWHRLPPTKKIKKPRVNLTFRKYYG